MAMRLNAVNTEDKGGPAEVLAPQDGFRNLLQVLHVAFTFI